MITQKNKLWSYVGEDCIIQMLIKLNEISKHVNECYKFAKEGSLLKFPRVSIKKEDAEQLTEAELKDILIPRMKFTNHKNKLERPYYVIADIEALVCEYCDEAADKKIQELKEKSEGQPVKEPGRKIAKHKPIAVCLYLVCTYDNTKK